MDAKAIYPMDMDGKKDDWFSCLSEMPMSPYSSCENVSGTSLESIFGSDAIDASSDWDPHPSEAEQTIKPEVKEQIDGFLPDIPDLPEFENEAALLVWKCSRFFESQQFPEGESDGKNNPYFDLKPPSADKGWEDWLEYLQYSAEVAEKDMIIAPSMSSDDNNNARPISPVADSDTDSFTDDDDDFPVPLVEQKNSIVLVNSLKGYPDFLRGKWDKEFQVDPKDLWLASGTVPYLPKRSIDPVQPSGIKPQKLDTPNIRPKKEPSCFRRLLSCITPSCLKRK